MTAKLTEPGEIHVVVHYPLPGEREGGESLALRASTDWDLDIEPTRSDPGSGRWDFVLRTDEPFLYVKPVLRRGAEVTWDIGPDRLTTSGAERVWDVFPAFAPAEPSFTEIESLDSPYGRWDYRVFLPPDYGENALHHYPVLYMNDGHNLFFPREAAVGQEWAVQDTLRELVEMTSIEPVIVVGVYPRDREADYAQHPSSDYPRFLAEVLKPHVDDRFRTLRAAKHTAIMGSSLGGVAALATAWQFPKAFGMAACLSSTFGYADDLAHRVLADERPSIRVYLDSGWPKDNFEVTRDMRARLVTAGFEEGTDLLYFVFPGDRHSERAWGDRCHVPFQFLFGQRPQRRSFAGRHAASQ